MTLREVALVSAATDFVQKVETGKARSTNSYRWFKAALAIQEDAEVYPMSDQGLQEMCPGVPLAVLRGIQEAAFRAGRESIAVETKRCKACGHKAHTSPCWVSVGGGPHEDACGCTEVAR